MKGCGIGFRGSIASRSRTADNPTTTTAAAGLCARRPTNPSVLANQRFPVSGQQKAITAASNVNPASSTSIYAVTSTSEATGTVNRSEHRDPRSVYGGIVYKHSAV